MKIDPSQLDLFVWAQSQPTAEIIDLTPIIVRLMPAYDRQYPTPAKVIRPNFPEKTRGVA